MAVNPTIRWVRLHSKVALLTASLLLVEIPQADTHSPEMPQTFIVSNGGIFEHRIRKLLNILFCSNS